MEEFKPETIPKFEIKEENIPWLTSDKLDANISIRWWNQTVKVLQFTKAASSGIWVTNYTWFWFKPSFYTVQSVNNNTTEPASISFSSYVWGNVSWYYLSPWTTYTQSQPLSTRMVCIYNASNNTRANHSAFISDWITLDWISHDIDVNFVITAYK